MGRIFSDQGDDPGSEVVGNRMGERHDLGQGVLFHSHLLPPETSARLSWDLLLGAARRSGCRPYREPTGAALRAPRWCPLNAEGEYRAHGRTVSRGKADSRDWTGRKPVPSGVDGLISRALRALPDPAAREAAIGGLLGCIATLVTLGGPCGPPAGRGRFPAGTSPGRRLGSRLCLPAAPRWPPSGVRGQGPSHGPGVPIQSP